MKERRLIIGIQGGRGSFNEEAIKRFTEMRGITKYSIKYLYTTERVLEALNKKKIDRGMFAIQNSLGGAVWETINALSKYNCKILESFVMHISHYLLAKPGSNLKDIKTVYSHPQAFAQTEKTFSRRYPQIKKKVGEGVLVDQATAAEALSLNKLPRGSAVLASKAAAEAFGLIILASKLEDKKPNLTTFLFTERFNKKSSGVSIVT